MKEQHVKAPTEWSPEWRNPHGESGAIDIAKKVKAKTFPTFWKCLVNIFGVCEEDCAIYLWNKINPTKARKVIVRFVD